MSSSRGHHQNDAGWVGREACGFCFVISLSVCRPPVTMDALGVRGLWDCPFFCCFVCFVCSFVYRSHFLEQLGFPESWEEQWEPSGHFLWYLPRKMEFLILRSAGVSEITKKEQNLVDVYPASQRPLREYSLGIVDYELWTLPKDSRHYGKPFEK